MLDFLAEWYLWVKALHIMAVITWMAGIFYLPRLFVYHVEGYDRKGVEPGSEMDLLFQRMERLLLRAIMNPSLVAVWIFGLCLVFTPGIVDWSSVWPWTKAAAVLAMTWYHHWLGKRRKDFVNGTNTRSGRTYRMMNELPTIFMVVIVLSVVLKF
ncbi:CopD family protein [Acidimangrovimonas pyrenivorans]|uniref:Protoporphyrinogen IX oxidase n=1 Tax=Acidimangrovimonas pyrenivorans TaxID=2030798 RepID=A0ABV7ALK4_9RHOB